MGCGRGWGADLVIELFQSVSEMPSEEKKIAYQLNSPLNDG